MATQGSGVTTVLTDSPVAIISAGANELITGVRIQITNRDTTSRLVTVYQVPSGGTAVDANIAHKQTVYAGQSTSIDMAGMMAANGASLHFKADVTNVVNLSVNQFRSDQQP